MILITEVSPFLPFRASGKYHLFDVFMLQLKKLY